MNIRVLVCCEDAILGAGMRALLDQQPDITVVGNTTGAESAAAAARQEPDVLVIVSPALTVEHKRELAALSADTKVVLIAKAENAARSIEALRVGVQAVLTPGSSADELVHVLRTVSVGGAIVLPEEARSSLHHLPDDGASATCLVAALTPRESEVIVLLAQGKSNADIAEKLSVSKATVRSHVHHLLRKLGVGTRAQAVAVAYESGLISALGRNSLLPDPAD